MKHFLTMIFMILCVAVFWGVALYLLLHAFLGEP